MQTRIKISNDELAYTFLIEFLLDEVNNIFFVFLQLIELLSKFIVPYIQLVTFCLVPAYKYGIMTYKFRMNWIVNNVNSYIMM